MGLAPPTVKEGDEICILFGGCVPFILRKRPENGLYQYIGEAYVSDIMDGEAISKGTGTLAQKQVFSIT